MHRLLLRSLRSSVVGVFAFAGAALHPAITHASSPFLTVPDPAKVETTAAYRYANMTNDEAIAELNRRGLPYVTVDPVPGVRAPIRLTGRLHGVLIHTALAPNQRATSPFEILDARLALALDDFTAILEKHDIDEIEHFSMYRPSKPPKSEKPTQQKAATPPKDSAPVAATTPKTAINPAKPVESPKAVSAHKPTSTKIAARSNTTAKHPKSPPAKPTAKKPAQISQKKAPTKPSPKTLGKAGLGPKTSTGGGEKGTKQKGPGQTEETISPDKQTEVVAEPLPKKEDAPQAQTQANSAPAPAPMGTRHPGGLAIDVGKLRKKDGTWLNVLTHFHGKIGARACGEDAPVPQNAEGRELRALVCEAMGFGAQGAEDDPKPQLSNQGNHLFTYVLTPNYNAAHADHFHMEIKPGVKWFMVH